MDEFIPVKKANRSNENDSVAKQRIIELSEKAESWQLQLVEIINDDNFARHFMVRMIKEIY